MSESEWPVEEGDLPEVSVLVPIKNEEGHIARCLDSILANDYPPEKYEILVIDGRSSDRSREIVKGYTEKDLPEVRLLDNPEEIVPTAMNIGLEEARGEIIIRIDGHSYVEDDFIPTSVRTLLEKKEAEAVGGPVRPVLDDSSSYLQRAISIALNSPAASGSARFSGKSGYVTTVSFGAYWAEVFEDYGTFDERFVRTQDYEMNYRIVSSGGRIFMNPEIRSYYYPRKSLINLWRQYFQFGFWKTKVIKKYEELISLRNLLPSIFVLGLFVLGGMSFFFRAARFGLYSVVGIYLLVTAYFGFLSLGQSGASFKRLFGVILAMITIHLGFGFGFIKGLMVDVDGNFAPPWNGL